MPCVIANALSGQNVLNSRVWQPERLKAIAQGIAL